MRRGFSEDAAHQIEAIGAAMQRERRLLAVFLRQCPHHRRADVGRIAQDQVVTPAGEFFEQVGADQSQALRHPVFAHIAPRHGECRSGNIDAVNLRPGKCVCGDNGKAAGSCTQIEYRPW